MAKRKAARFDKTNPTHVRRALEKQIKKDKKRIQFDQLAVDVLRKLESLKRWAGRPVKRRKSARRKSSAK